MSAVDLCLSCPLPDCKDTDPRCLLRPVKITREKRPKKYPAIPHGNITRRNHFPKAAKRPTETI